MNKIKKTKIFELFIWTKILTDITSDKINNAYKYCMELKSKSEGRIVSNVGGWQSNSMEDWDHLNTPLEPIFNSIKNETDVVINEYTSGLIKEYVFANSWININGKNDFNSPHEHSKSMLSGVYYLTDNNSPIEFIFPFVESEWYGNQHNNFCYTPSKNELIIFPSFLLHMVHPNLNEEFRLSIAFNTDTIEGLQEPPFSFSEKYDYI